MKGEVSVEVTFSEDAIQEVKVVSQQETYGVGQGMTMTPVKTLPGLIVEHRSLAIDTLTTGATITSNAILNAVSKAVEAAGGDVAPLKAVEVKARIKMKF